MCVRVLGWVWGFFSMAPKYTSIDKTCYSGIIFIDGTIFQMIKMYHQYSKYNLLGDCLTNVGSYLHPNGY